MFLSSNANRVIHFFRRRKVRRKKERKKEKGRERERERDKPFLARQNFEPVIKCMRRRWIRLSTLGHRSCFRIFTHPLSDSSSGCFVATYTRSAALPLYTSSSSSSSSVSLAPLHPFRATRRFPYPGYVWNRVDRGNSLAWKFPRATSCCCSNWDVDTPKPTLHFPKLRLSISLSHRFIENPLRASLLGSDGYLFLLRKKERKRRIKSAKARYFLNIAKIFVKIRFRDDIFLREERIFPSFVIPRVETRSFFFFFREMRPKRGV